MAPARGSCDEFAYLVGAPREMRVLDETGQRLFEQELHRAGCAAARPRRCDPDSFTALGGRGPGRPAAVWTSFLLKLKGRGIGPERVPSPGARPACRAMAHGRRPARRSERRCRAGPREGRARGDRGAAPRLPDVRGRACAHGGCADFDDFILQVIDALERVPEFRRRCRERFRYLLVDEFQDTNRIQLDLMRLLAADGFAQRGGGRRRQAVDLRLARRRDREHPQPRSPGGGFRSRTTAARTRGSSTAPPTSSAATRISRRARAGRDARPGCGRPVTVRRWPPDARTEARSVAQAIRRLHVAGRRLGEIAILAHSIRMLPREFEEELRAPGHPLRDQRRVGLLRPPGDQGRAGAAAPRRQPDGRRRLVRVLQGPIVRLPDARHVPARLPADRTPAACGCATASTRPRAKASPRWSRRSPRGAVRLVELTDGLGRLRDALTVADILNRLLEESGYLRLAELRAQRDGALAPCSTCARSSRWRAVSSATCRSPASATSCATWTRSSTPSFPSARRRRNRGGRGGTSAHDPRAPRASSSRWSSWSTCGRRGPRDTERLFFDPDGLGFVMKSWRGEQAPALRGVVARRAGRQAGDRRAAPHRLCRLHAREGLART